MSNRLQALNALSAMKLFSGPNQVYAIYALQPMQGCVVTKHSVVSAQVIDPDHPFFSDGERDILPSEDGTVFFHRERGVYLWIAEPELKENKAHQDYMARLLTRDWIQRQMGVLQEQLDQLNDGIII